MATIRAYGRSYDGGSLWDFSAPAVDLSPLVLTRGTGSVNCQQTATTAAD